MILLGIGRSFGIRSFHLSDLYSKAFYFSSHQAEQKHMYRCLIWSCGWSGGGLGDVNKTENDSNVRRPDVLHFIYSSISSYI